MTSPSLDLDAQRVRAVVKRITAAIVEAGEPQGDLIFDAVAVVLDYTIQSAPKHLRQELAGQAIVRLLRYVEVETVH